MSSPMTVRESEFIDGILPSIVCGLLADESAGGEPGFARSYDSESLPRRAFSLAQALFEEGLKRGVYKRDFCDLGVKPPPTAVPGSGRTS